MTSLRPFRFGVYALFALAVQGCATRGSPSPPAEVAVVAASPPCTSVRVCLTRCDEGDARACTLAADRIRQGRGAARDEPHAERLYQEACDAHDGLGCAGLSWMRRGAEARAARERALPLLEAACEQKDAEACVALGSLLLQEQPQATARSHRLMMDAVSLLDAACQRGEGEACARAATLLDSGATSSRDPPRVLTLLQKACDAGIPGGCSGLAMRYITGRDVPPDRARATALFRRSGALFSGLCEAGEAASCAELARALRSGEGVAADSSAALALEERACSLGDADSCAGAASRLPGAAEGVPSDEARARALQSRARVLREEGCRRGSGTDCLALAEDSPPEARQSLRARACELGRTEACP